MPMVDALRVRLGKQSKVRLQYIAAEKIKTKRFLSRRAVALQCMCLAATQVQAHDHRL